MERALDALAHQQVPPIVCVSTTATAGAEVVDSALRHAQVAGVRAVVSGPSAPLSLHDLVTSLVAEPVDRLVACVRDVGRCDGLTRVAAELVPPLVGRTRVLWLLTGRPTDQVVGAHPSRVVRTLDDAPELVIGRRAERPHVEEPPVSDVLVAAAALGPTFTVPELHDLVGSPVGALVAPLTTAHEAGVLLDEGHEFAFADLGAWRRLHVQAEDGLRVAAARLHARNGSVSRLRTLLQHDVLVPDEGIEDLDRFEQELARTDLDMAARLATRRIAASGLADTREVLEARRAFYALQAGTPGAASAFLPLLDRDPGAMLGSAVAEGAVVADTGRAVALAQRLLPSCPEGTAERARLNALVTTCLAFVGSADGRSVDRSVAQAERTGDARALSMARLGRVVTEAARGDLPEALRHAALGSEPPADRALGPTSWMAAFFRATLLVDLGRLDEAERVLDACAHLVEGRGQATAIPHLLIGRAGCALERGRLADAATYLHAARHLAHAIGQPGLAETNALAGLIQIATMRGDLDALAELRGLIEPRVEVELLRQEAAASGIVTAADTDTAADLEALVEWAELAAAGIDDRAQDGVLHVTYSVLRSLPERLTTLRLLLRRGRYAEARAVSEMVTLVADRARTGFTTALADHAAGLVDGHAAWVRTALAQYREHARPLLVAQALEDLAGLEAVDRVERLREARRTWFACGARREAIRVDRVLGALGVRDPIPERVTSSLGLTGAEQRVLEELMSGQTNAQIARALLLSKNTVAVHLRRIYSKTGVGSREELVELARRTGAGPGSSRST